MSSQIQKKDLIVNNQKKVIELLDKMKPQLALCLPKHLSVDRVCRIALTEFRKTPLLMECDPMSFIAAVMVASQLGLEIGILGAAYIVPFRNHKKNIVECNFIPGYRGLMDLAYRSGRISTFEAEVVYENDGFEYEKGLNPKLFHKPALSNRGKMKGVYSIAQLKDGGQPCLFRNKEEIDEVKAKAKSQSGPWLSDYDAMAQKTVIRRLFKWLPSSVEMQKAAIFDEQSEAGIQDIKGIFKEEISSLGMSTEFLGEDSDMVDTETGEIKSQADELSEKLREESLEFDKQVAAEE